MLPFFVLCLVGSFLHVFLSDAWVLCLLLLLLSCALSTGVCVARPCSGWLEEQAWVRLATAQFVRCVLIGSSALG